MTAEIGSEIAFIFVSLISSNMQTFISSGLSGLKSGFVASNEVCE